jgi:hypothetical protein
MDNSSSTLDNMTSSSTKSTMRSTINITKQQVITNSILVVNLKSPQEVLNNHRLQREFKLKVRMNKKRCLRRIHHSNPKEQ